MKLYTIPKGTEAVLMTRHEDGSVTQSPWKARTDLSFTDTVIDPIRIMNQSYDSRSFGFQLAKKGYAIFVDEPGQPNKYALAVKYDMVTVL